jgi:TetR/AcrR family transcriptional regulator, transcriptional repressor for nem operon
VARQKEFEPDVALDSAMRLFWEKGYEATSVQDLVDTTGVGRRSLYDTFGDKHALFMRCLARYTELQDRATEGIDGAAGGGREGVRILFASAVSQEAQGKGCLLVNSATEVAPHDSEAQQWIDRRLNGVRRLLLDLVRRGRQDETIANRTDPEVLANLLFSAWLGLRVSVRAGASRRRVRKDLDDILAVLDQS